VGHPLRLAVCLIASILGSGCGSFLKEFAPINPGSVSLRVPNQQRLLSQSVLQAVTSAAADASLNLAQYAGRSALVEVNGVLPHTQEDLLDYVAAAVESEIARAGLRVVPRPPLQRFAVRGEGGEGMMVNIIPRPIEGPPQSADLRLVASVDWGGVDYQERKYIVAGRLAGQLGLLGGGLFFGSIAYGVGLSRGDFLGGITAGTLFMFGGPIAAGIWRLARSPTARTFTLSGRVRVTLRAIPVAAALKPAQGVGEGEARMIIDTESASGYTNSMALPRKR
jgi:hypothetical protein